MSRLLTIRDPLTSDLVAEEPLSSDEGEDLAVARVYRRTLGPGVPELQVISKAVFLDDESWFDEIAKNWGSFQLVVLGPRGEPDPKKWRLILSRISGSAVPSNKRFPLERSELDAVKKGRRHEGVVPSRPDDPPKVGDTVIFEEAAWDPFGVTVLVPNGCQVTVKLTKVGSVPLKWAGQDLYQVSWELEPGGAAIRSQPSA